MPKPTDQPSYLYVQIAAVLTLWGLVAIGLLIMSFVGDEFTFLEALKMGLMLYGVAIIACIISGLISFPLWLFCKYVFGLNLITAAGVGGLTAAIITAYFVKVATRDDLNVIIAPTQSGLMTQIGVILLGMIAGWNGYRVARNSRRRLFAQKE